MGRSVSGRSAGRRVPSSQVTGRAALQSTTLQSLGLTGGSATIRWGPRSLIQGRKVGSGRKGSRHRGSPAPPLAASPACGLGVGHPALCCGCGGCSRDGLGSVGPRGEPPRGDMGPHEPSLTLWAPLRFAMKPWDAASTQEPGAAQSRSPGSPRLTPAGQAAGSPLLPLNPAGLSHGDVSRQDAAASAGPGLTDGPGPTPADAQAKPVAKEPAPAPFVPFSGGGQRLGGPCGAARPLVSPSAKPPKSFSSPAGPSKPKKSRPGQEPQQEPEPELEPVRSEPGAGVLSPART